MGGRSVKRILNNRLGKPLIVILVSFGLIVLASGVFADVEDHGAVYLAAIHSDPAIL